MNKKLKSIPKFRNEGAPAGKRCQYAYRWYQ